MKVHVEVVVVGLLGLTGCEDVIDLDPLDTRPVVESRVRPKPISGGTLAVNNAVAVAADPDRDVISIVHVKSRTLTHTIALEPGDEPGRVVFGSGDQAHVVLRGFGGIATIDTATGAVTSRRSVCTDPRGLAFDSSSVRLHVACADGTVHQIPEQGGARLASTTLEPDLRDVVLVDGEPVVTTLRSAKLILGDGTWDGPTIELGIPHVAWRTIEADGDIVMLHQTAAPFDIPITPAVDPFTGDAQAAYGGGDSDFCRPGIVLSAVSTFHPYDTGADSGIDVTTREIIGLPLTVDVAVHDDLVALATPGAEEGPTLRVDHIDDLSAFGTCFETPSQRYADAGQVTAVAFDDDGTLVAFSREPAQLMIDDGDVVLVDLGGESRYDTGHEIFHRTTESDLSCASCHPEGGDDGHVWNFRLGSGAIVPRRTQSLDVGLADTAPFHWEGDMKDLDQIMGEVLAHRMGGRRQTPERRESFKNWLFEQQRPPADTGEEDPVLVAEGAALFESFACTKCHFGAALGGETTEPIRGVPLQVPTLRRVATHPPFMHDGRSATLADAVRDMIDSTTTAEYSASQVEAMTAYLRTL